MGLIARHAESSGIATLCMSTALDITRAVNPPLAAFLDFPLGHTTGKPGQPELQRTILYEALRAFETLQTPGSVTMLPFRWADDDAWKRTAFASDARTPRWDTPQYQTEQDRQRAEADSARTSSCPLCNGR